MSGHYASTFNVYEEWEDIYDTLNEHGNELKYSIFKELNKTCFINMINTKKAI